MPYPLTTFAESSSGLGALGVDGHAFIIQLITFVLAYLVLRRYAFGPILRVLKERRDTIDSGVKLGEAMRKERAELEAKVEATIHQTRTKAEAIIASAQETAKQTIREAEDKAKQKAQSILDQADDRIVQDTQRARKELEKELVGLISEATEAIIDEKVDSKKDAQLIARALKGVRT